MDSSPNFISFESAADQLSKELKLDDSRDLAIFLRSSVSYVLDCLKTSQKPTVAFEKALFELAKVSRQFVQYELKVFPPKASLDSSEREICIMGFGIGFSRGLREGIALKSATLITNADLVEKVQLDVRDVRVCTGVALKLTSKLFGEQGRNPKSPYFHFSAPLNAKK